MWLEKGWNCPDCVAPMHSAPFRHYGEENGIRQDFPDWDDQSQVDYSFDGLVFPKPPSRLISLPLF